MDVQPPRDKNDKLRMKRLAPFLIGVVFISAIDLALTQFNSYTVMQNILLN
jgi:hypothetical protein